MGIFIAIVLLVIGLGIVAVIIDGKEKKRKIQALNDIPDFEPSIFFVGASSIESTCPHIAIAIDPKREKFATTKNGEVAKVYPFSSVLSVEIVKNGESLQKTNRGSQAAGAVVGAVLLGPIGLLLGGVTGSKRSVEKVKKLSLSIFTKNLENPLIEICFLDSKNGHSPDSSIVKGAVEDLNNWYGRFQAVVSAGAH
ncbi:MAG: hypothetical protein PHD48_02740 [Alphaproteobacteria bacterium]|nr:hypothetical protein [Alphaproteobacteria bacterium]